MNQPSSKPLAFLLILLILLPTKLVSAQQSNTKPAQTGTESREDQELQKRQDNLNKKEDERKRKEEKTRAEGEKKYLSLNEFAEDLYASDHDFHEAVDEKFLEKQTEHALRAYRLNVLTGQGLFSTATDFKSLRNLGSVYQNPRVQEYVNRLGQQLIPDDSDKLYSFKVIFNPIPHAYTLSTGTIFISTGMISLLDNEAQLAYVLAHEMTHIYKDHWRIKVMNEVAAVEYNRRQERKRNIWKAVLTAAGGGIGAAIAGKDGVLLGMGSGFIAGDVIGDHYVKDLSLDWTDSQENEADDFALKTILGKSYDIQEVPKLFVQMASVAQSDDRMELGFLGKRSRIKGRTEYAQKTIGGSLKSQYDLALRANKIKGVSPEFNLIMADLKRDNGIEAFSFDMLGLARMNLQQSVTLRSDDPLANFYYGLVLKQVGRTAGEIDHANQYLVRAINLDVRHEIPAVQLQRGLLLMDSKDRGQQEEAVAAFKKYITDYGRKEASKISNEELVPPSIDTLYSYMRVLGEKTWTAPTVLDVIRATTPSTSSPASPTNTAATSNPANTELPPAMQLPRIEPASNILSPTANRPRP